MLRCMMWAIAAAIRPKVLLVADNLCLRPMRNLAGLQFCALQGFQALEGLPGMQNRPGERIDGREGYKCERSIRPHRKLGINRNRCSGSASAPNFARTSGAIAEVDMCWDNMNANDFHPPGMSNFTSPISPFCAGELSEGKARP